MTRGRKIFLVVIALAVSYPLVGMSLSIVHTELSIAEMDWNGDGRTTIGEIFDTTDVGVRPVEIDGKSCREVYALKDGLPVKTLCP